MGILKLPKLGLPKLWGPITLCADLGLRWGLKQSCSPHWEFFNDMPHATCTQGNRVDSKLLMVGSQTANMTLGFSFGHNLCFRCPNGHASPLQTYLFQYLFNGIKNSLIHWVLTLKSFFEHSKVQLDSNSKSGSSLRSVRVYSFTLSCTPGST
jgi:hypothetical protein